MTDKLTGLIWTKNGNVFGKRTWTQALSDANGLKSGDADLTDGSKAGDWRLPNVRELQSLIDCGRINPALPEGHPFTEVQPYWYWTSTTYTADPTLAWDVAIGISGQAEGFEKQATADDFVWCVRGGR